MVNKLIKSAEISFVVQGPIFLSDPGKINYTQIACESIRTHYPDSELILSTWEGSNVEGILVDKVIYNKDPGSIEMELNGSHRTNNTNRMIVSTLNGIKASTRKYVFRIRSDLIVTNNKMLTFSIEKKNYKNVFRNYIVILPVTNRYTKGKLLFSITDWAYFGLRNDILNLYSIPLMSVKQLIKGNNIPSWEENVVSEQYIIKTFFQQFERYELLKGFHKMYQYSRKLAKLNNYILRNEFLILDSYQFSGLKSLKYTRNGFLSKSHRYSFMTYHEDWKYMYLSLRTLFDIRFYFYGLKKLKQFLYYIIDFIFKFSIIIIKLIGAYNYNKYYM